MGKTRLMQEVVMSPELNDATKMIGHCHNFLDPFPFGPFVEALRDVRGLVRLEPAALNPVTAALRPLLPELADQLPPALAAIEDSDARRHQQFRGTLELLRAVGRAVVVIEDFHWADEGTRDFLSFLLPQCPEQLSLIITFRHEELLRDPQMLSTIARGAGATPCVRVRLERLQRKEVPEMIKAILGADNVSDEFVSFVDDHSGGIPFAIEEMLKLLQDRQDLVLRDGRWERKEIGRAHV